MKWFFLRGIIRESGHWSGFLERFQARFPSVEIHPLDLPGCGKNSTLTCPAQISAITDLLRSQAPLDPGGDNNLFALSLGAMVGFDWMSRYPHDFKRAVLLNTSMRGLSPFHERLMPRNYLGILRLLFSSNLERKERYILSITANDEARREQCVPAWVEIQRARPVSTGNKLRQLLAAARFHPPTEKPGAKMILLNANGDRLVAPRCSEKIAAHWHVPLRTHPTAGHDLTLDAPDWVLEQVDDFLKT